MYRSGVIGAENRVAQLENLALWLVKDGTSPWLWVIPDTVEVSVEGGVTFLRCDRTWVAVRPLGTGVVRVDPVLTEQLREAKNARFPGHQVLSAAGNHSSFCGVAIEVGDAQSHLSFDNFRKQVMAAEVDVRDLGAGAVRYLSGGGQHLGIHWNDNPLDLGVWRNGNRRDLAMDANDLYRSPVINSHWGSGVLEVTAGGEQFRCEVGEDGKVTFSNQRPGTR
jgi:hypothetical protein